MAKRFGKAWLVSMTSNKNNEMILDVGVSQVIVKIIQDHGLDILNENEKFLSLL